MCSRKCEGSIEKNGTKAHQQREKRRKKKDKGKMTMNRSNSGYELYEEVKN